MPFSSDPPGLESEDVERFSRQIICDGIGAEGMLKIKNGRVVCVGLGGLGSTIALYLTAAGVGHLTFVDHDIVESSNLHRQVIHTTDAVGRPKVESAKEACLRVYPGAQIDTVQEMISPTNAVQLFRDSDVVVDGTDNVASRFIINDAAMLCGKPLVSGSAMRWEGQLSVYGYRGGPCYRCVFPTPPPPAAVGSCNDTGVIGPLPGTIGCLQALETLKILADTGDTLSGRLLVFDGKRFTSRVVKLRGRNVECPACCKAAVEQGTLPAREEYIPGACLVGAAFSAILLSNEQQRIGIRAFGEMYKNRRKGVEEAVRGGSDTVGQVDVFVDVRASIQYRMAFLPDTVNLPLSELQRWKRESVESCREKWDRFVKESMERFVYSCGWAPDKSVCVEQVRIFLLCRRGVASAQATQLVTTLPLEKNGGWVLSGSHTAIVNIGNVDGGLNAYHKEVDASFPYY